MSEGKAAADAAGNANTEPKFTKGPWRTQKGDSVVHIIAAGGAPIANTSTKEYWRKLDAIDEANAHLMSAAPELYEALWRLLGTAERGNATTHEPGCRCVIHEAEAALAKARGEQ